MHLAASVVRTLHVYPVKSMRGIEVVERDVEPWGLKDDRRWVVLAPDGSRLSGREDRRLLGFSAIPREGGGVEILAGDGSAIEVRAPFNGEFAATSISRLNVVRLAEPAVHEWLSDRLSRPARLGWLDDPSRRPVSPAHGGLNGDALSLADAGPLLLTSEASLRLLNEWITASTDAGQKPDHAVMARFRPNVVVGGVDEPFAEDGWSRVRIGGVTYRQSEQCDRCMMTLIEPKTLVQGKEPLRSLARHRRRDGRTWFGIRLIPESIGRIAVGDQVDSES